MGEEIGLIIIKLWKPVLSVLGAVVSGLYLYFHGKSVGTTKERLKNSEAESEMQQKIINIQKKYETNKNTVESIYNGIPDKYDNSVRAKKDSHGSL